MSVSTPNHRTTLLPMIHEPTSSIWMSNRGLTVHDPPYQCTQEPKNCPPRGGSCTHFRTVSCVNSKLSLSPDAARCISTSVITSAHRPTTQQEPRLKSTPFCFALACPYQPSSIQISFLRHTALLKSHSASASDQNNSSPINQPVQSGQNQTSFFATDRLVTDPPYINP